MDKMTAYCGLACHECGAFLATKKDDDKKRAEVAQEWSKQFNYDLKPEDINCDGCLSQGGVLFKHCNDCVVRKCGMEKGVDTCAHCDEYSCEKLEKFYEVVPVPRNLLEDIRKTA